MNNAFNHNANPRGRMGPDVGTPYQDEIYAPYLQKGVLPEDPMDAFSACLAAAGHICAQQDFTRASACLGDAATQLSCIEYKGLGPWVLSRGIAFSGTLMGRVVDQSVILGQLQNIIQTAIGIYPESERRAGYVAAFDKIDSGKPVLQPYREALAFQALADAENGMRWNRFIGEPLKTFLIARGLPSRQP